MIATLCGFPATSVAVACRQRWTGRIGMRATPTLPWQHDRVDRSADRAWLAPETPPSGDPVSPDPRIRTFHGRHGRVTDRMRRVLTQIGPDHHLDARSDPDRPLVLEVGAGHGEAALAFADAHPDTDVLAVDVHTPGVVALLRAAHESATPNLFAMRADALVLLDERLGPGSLAGVHLFFPDPWPKARHHKRRFVRPDVLALLANRMASGAPFRMATDWADYAEAARARLDDHADFAGGVDGRPDWRPVTRYEAAAKVAGRDVVDLEYRRR